MSRITPDQIDFYQKNGYHLHYKPVLTPARFQRLKTLFEELLAQSDKRPDELNVPHFD